MIDVHEGKEKTIPFLDGTAIISVITEIELLGWHKITATELTDLTHLIEDCIVIELIPKLKTWPSK